jgi:DNA-binding XRE family transcriptional regulator
MARWKLTNDELKRERESIALETLKFRQKYLFTQFSLAEHMGVSRRTIQMIEAGRVMPHPSTRRAFIELKRTFANQKTEAA